MINVYLILAAHLNGQHRAKDTFPVHCCPYCKQESDQIDEACMQEYADDGAEDEADDARWSY